NPTTSNYIIINKSTGSATQIKRSNPEINLTKYKYEFIPDYIIMDGTDPSGSIAALNNFPNATSILLATKVSEELHSISKRCNYVVANTTFAKALTKMNLELNKNKLVVNFMQKIKDLNKARYIITLGDKGVLYVSDNQVKLLPATLVEKIEDDSNASPAFFGALCYGLINNYDIDKAVKIANITAGLALTTIGSVKSVPELSEVLNMAGLKEVIETEEHENEEESPSTNLPNIKEEEVPAIQV
ncbi:MAG: PfkB family carbohydrate kinase, partial [Bacilli bacterium]|nr:PfkB family carbohydrate kinase [Bacilli bacterium]